LSEFLTERSEKRPEKLEATNMSACAEAASLLRSVAEPRPVGDTVKEAINRAARLTGLRYGRAEDIWRQEARTIRADEMDRIRRAAENKLVREAQHEFVELEQRIKRLEALLVQAPDLPGPEDGPVRRLAHPVDRAMGGRSSRQVGAGR